MRPVLRPLGVLLAGLSLFCAVSGCMEPQTTPARPQDRWGRLPHAALNTTDYDTAFAAAQGAVMDHFQVAFADRATGVIHLAPSETTRLGGAYSRRVGQVIIRNTGKLHRGDSAGAGGKVRHPGHARHSAELPGRSSSRLHAGPGRRRPDAPAAGVLDARAARHGRWKARFSPRSSPP